MEWQAIETAPKDSRSVMLFGIWAGEINGVSLRPSIHIGHWEGGKSDYPGADWWELDEGDAYACWIQPTHWMPLPPPPGAE